MNSIFLISQAGCLLPTLILFNLFFGWLFFKPLTWLAIEGFLIILFLLNSYILSRRLSVASRRNRKVIDIEGEIVEDRDKVK